MRRVVKFYSGRKTKHFSHPQDLARSYGRAPYPLFNEWPAVEIRDGIYRTQLWPCFIEI